MQTRWWGVGRCEGRRLSSSFCLPRPAAVLEASRVGMLCGDDGGTPRCDGANPVPRIRQSKHGGDPLPRIRQSDSPPPACEERGGCVPLVKTTWGTISVWGWGCSQGVRAVSPERGILVQGYIAHKNPPPLLLGL